MAIPIHISDIRSFRQCRRKWNWSSQLRNGLEPAVPYAPFFTGRAIHHCLENYYKSQKPIWDSLDDFYINEEKIFGAMWKSELAMIEEQKELIAELLRHYMLWIQVDTSAYRDETLQFIDLEIPFDVPLYLPGTQQVSDKIFLQGRFDGLVFHKPTETYWIWETKTTRSIGELARSLENDEQAGAYVYAAQQLKKLPITGVLYNVIRKKAPSHPKELRDGMLSKAKNIDTTPFAYVADVKAHHGDVDWNFIKQFYGDVIDSMSIGNNGFFARYPIKRSPYEIDMLAQNLYHTGMEMINLETVTYPAPSWLNCNFCSFRAPCLAMNKGFDYQALLDAEFKGRESAVSMREVREDDAA